MWSGRGRSGRRGARAFCISHSVRREISRAFADEGRMSLQQQASHLGFGQHVVRAQRRRRDRGSSLSSLLRSFRPYLTTLGPCSQRPYLKTFIKYITHPSSPYKLALWTFSGRQWGTAHLRQVGMGKVCPPSSSLPSLRTR